MSLFQFPHGKPISITPPSIIPQPSTSTNQHFDTFTPPKKHYVNSHFPTNSFQPTPQHCPICFQSVHFFRLPDDPTNTVFCSKCRQPYYHCPVHLIPIAGIGFHMSEFQKNQCLCVKKQAFLNMSDWSSCFN
jgi:hypothetical protein